MQAASRAYKEEMKKRFRNRSYMRVTLGLINQQAQAAASIPDPASYAYFSNLKKPFDNYRVDVLYATCDQDFSVVDGSMYFLPREAKNVVLNQGIVTEDLQGAVEIGFPVAYDIKGITIEFGKAYPVSFTIESDNHTVEIVENGDGHFVTEEVFPEATHIRIVPNSMVNGQSRLRIHQIIMGIGIYFDNRKILSATQKEYISPIMEELPSMDFALTVDNKDGSYDIENESSALNFLEIGQAVEVLYGLELESREIEWIPGTTAYLRTWSADDKKMSFTASDRFEDLNGIYYKGIYREEGITLYDLAVDVMEDAGIDSRDYRFDSYLKTIVVYNPMPAVSHKEALQLIANAGRCLLNQDRTGKIYIKPAFVPDITVSSDNETYYSNAEAVLDGTQKDDYAAAAQNYTGVAAAQYFLPRNGEKLFLNTGYISEAVADSEGLFVENPILQVMVEARYKCFGLTLEFGRNHPQEMVFRTYLDDELQEEYLVDGISEEMSIMHEFPEFNKLELEFTKGTPNNRVVLNNIIFGDSTDYELSYGRELTSAPQGTLLEKVRELQVIRTLYNPSSEIVQLTQETVEASGDLSRHTFYFTNPSYELSCQITDQKEGQEIRIVESSNYFATVEISGVSGECEVLITGYEYVLKETRVSRQLNTTGALEKWSNPLVSTEEQAQNLAEWIGDYFRANREYNLPYRGEPRIDANDIMFLENKYVSDLLVRVYEHDLKFNGALSGTIKARRDMANVAASKNRLESQ